MEDQIKKLVKRFESLEKTVNLIYSDRDLLEETSIRVKTLDDTVKHLTERMQKLEKKMSADIADVADTVSEVKDTVENLGES